MFLILVIVFFIVTRIQLHYGYTSLKLALIAKLLCELFGIDTGYIPEKDDELLY